MEDLERELKLTALEELEDHITELSELMYERTYDQIGQTETDQIFRVAHSVKGTMSAAGFIKLKSLSHEYETKLYEFKELNVPYDQKLHDLGASYLAILSDALDLYKNDLNAELDISSFGKDTPKSNKEEKVATIVENHIDNTLNKDKISVLIIDDDKVLTDTLKMCISDQYNATFKTAENGERGLELASQEIYDFIVCDYMMPILDGKEFVHITRDSNNVNNKTPIIFISGLQPEISTDGPNLDNLFYIDKPFTPSKLMYYIKCSLTLGKDAA